jgi:divalent metal cation (Fe/Co/Zn/Cd) transporter
MRLACVSLVVMRILSREKKRVANELGCSAMHADVKQTDFCFQLSVILLLGLVLNVALGWWWAARFLLSSWRRLLRGRD